VYAVFGINSDGLNLAVNLLILFLVAIYLALVYWTYMDALRRIADPMLVICATVASLFPFIGTIIYVMLCPHCDYEVEKDFLRCPTCLRKLRDPCGSCGRPLDPAWKICPYCEAELSGSTAEGRVRRRATAREPRPQ
jgi:predicted amidophosphoribosyltransferase